MYYPRNSAQQSSTGFVSWRLQEPTRPLTARPPFNAMPHYDRGPRHRRPFSARNWTVAELPTPTIVLTGSPAAYDMAVSNPRAFLSIPQVQQPGTQHFGLQGSAASPQVSEELRAESEREEAEARKREDELRTLDLIRRETERSKAELAELLTEQRHLVASLQEELQREREGRDAAMRAEADSHAARYAERDQREAALRAQVAALQSELETARREQQKAAAFAGTTVDELRATLTHEREANGALISTLQAQLADLKAAYISAACEGHAPRAEGREDRVSRGCGHGDEPWTRREMDVSNGLGDERNRRAGGERAVEAHAAASGETHADFTQLDGLRSGTPTSSAQRAGGEPVRGMARGAHVTGTPSLASDAAVAAVDPKHSAPPSAASASCTLPSSALGGVDDSTDNETTDEEIASAHARLLHADKVLLDDNDHEEEPIAPGSADERASPADEEPKPVKDDGSPVLDGNSSREVEEQAHLVEQRMCPRGRVEEAASNVAVDEATIHAFAQQLVKTVLDAAEEHAAQAAMPADAGRAHGVDEPHALNHGLLLDVDEPWGINAERVGGALDRRQSEMDTSTEMEETIHAFAQHLVKAVMGAADEHAAEAIMATELEDMPETAAALDEAALVQSLAATSPPRRTLQPEAAVTSALAPSSAPMTALAPVPAETLSPISAPALALANASASAPPFGPTSPYEPKHVQRQMQQRMRGRAEAEEKRRREEFDHIREKMRDAAVKHRVAQQLKDDEAKRQRLEEVATINQRLASTRVPLRLPLTSSAPAAVPAAASAAEALALVPSPAFLASAPLAPAPAPLAPERIPILHEDVSGGGKKSPVSEDLMGILLAAPAPSATAG